MEYHIKILLLAFAVAFVISLIIIPILRKRKIGQSEREEGPKSHLKKKGTPTMGGIIMMISLVIMGGVVYFGYIRKDAQEAQSMAKNFLPILIAVLGFGLVGFIDDFKKVVLKNTEGLKPRYKMLGLLIVATVFIVYLIKVMGAGTDIIIPFAKTTVTMPIWAYIPFSIVVMLATTNAINLTDGIDGLSTSVTTIILTCLTVIGIVTGVKEIVVFGASLIGICLAFLLFNLHPAKIFYLPKALSISEVECRRHPHHFLLHFLLRCLQ